MSTTQLKQIISRFLQFAAFLRPWPLQLPILQNILSHIWAYWGVSLYSVTKAFIDICQRDRSIRYKISYVTDTSKISLSLSWEAQFFRTIADVQLIPESQSDCSVTAFTLKTHNPYHRKTPSRHYTASSVYLTALRTAVINITSNIIFPLRNRISCPRLASIFIRH